MKKARVNQISGAQLACLIIVFRFSTLMLSRSVSYTQYFVQIITTAVLSFFVYCLYKKGAVIKNNALFYAACTILGAVVSLDIMQYFGFTTGVGSSNVPVWIIALLLGALTLYSGVLGIEAVSRFSVLAVITSGLFLLALAVTDLPLTRWELFICPQSERINIWSVIKCVDVPLLFLLIAPDTSKNQGSALLFGTGAAYAADAMIIVLCRAVLGKTAGIYSSPVFALFQLAEAGDFNKLDVMYVTIILLLLFCEISLVVSLFARRIKKQVKK
ncbi:MAG: hypothetical protein IKF64_00520 [Eubacterium sp.]|nr:hypothetical protein [Eubacterium sp.]